MRTIEELKRDFAVAADSDGLVEVAYARVDSPLGELLLAATPRGLVRVDYGVRGFDVELERLATLISPRVLELPERLDPARRELDEFFSGRRREFDLPLDWRLTSGFRRRVLRATARIPFGDTSTYAGVARAAGSPAAHRAAGTALGSNPLPIVVPCHRVLRTGGAIGGYGGGLERKRALLALESG